MALTTSLAHSTLRPPEGAGRCPRTVPRTAPQDGVCQSICNVSRVLRPHLEVIRREGVRLSCGVCHLCVLHGGKGVRVWEGVRLVSCTG
jgi:hypothetical protein